MAANIQSAYQANLVPASFGGVGFFTSNVEARVGRRIARHEYPWRDTVFAEDMGRAFNEYRIAAFLVGDNVGQFYQALQSVCSADGPQMLVTPSYGSIMAECVQMEAVQTIENGRVLTFNLLFIEAGSVLTVTQVAADTANNLAKASVTIEDIDLQYNQDATNNIASLSTGSPLSSTDPGQGIGASGAQPPSQSPATLDSVAAGQPSNPAPDPATGSLSDRGNAAAASNVDATELIAQYGGGGIGF